MKAFAARVTGKTIGTFITMGAEPEDPRAQAWAKKVSGEVAALGKNNTLKATFLCQGRIDSEVFDRMTQMMGGKVTPEREARRKAADTHPDRSDLEHAAEAMAPLFA